MEMVMADLERANERATATEREAERLKHQLSNLTASLADKREGWPEKGPDMEQAIEILQRSNLEAELAAKEREVSFHCFLMVTIHTLLLLYTNFIITPVFLCSQNLTKIYRKKLHIFADFPHFGDRFHALSRFHCWTTSIVMSHVRTG